MSHVILSGPALATEPNASTYYIVLDTTSINRPLASIEVNTTNKTKLLTLHTSYLEIDLPAIMCLVSAVLKQYKGTSIVATDSTGLVLAMALTAAQASTDPAIVAAWTKLNFVIEASSDDAPTVNKVRFVGTNIAGIKALSASSSITFTISSK